MAGEVDKQGKHVLVNALVNAQVTAKESAWEFEQLSRVTSSGEESMELKVVESVILEAAGTVTEGDVEAKVRANGRVFGDLC